MDAVTISHDLKIHSSKFEISIKAFLYHFTEKTNLFNNTAHGKERDLSYCTCGGKILQLPLTTHLFHLFAHVSLDSSFSHFLHSTTPHIRCGFKQMLTVYYVIKPLCYLLNILHCSHL